MSEKLNNLPKSSIQIQAVYLYICAFTCCSVLPFDFCIPAVLADVEMNYLRAQSPQKIPGLLSVCGVSDGAGDSSSCFISSALTE